MISGLLSVAQRACQRGEVRGPQAWTLQAQEGHDLWLCAMLFKAAVMRNRQISLCGTEARLSSHMKMQFNYPAGGEALGLPQDSEW